MQLALRRRVKSLRPLLLLVSGISALGATQLMTACCGPNSGCDQCAEPEQPDGGASHTPAASGCANANGGQDAASEAWEPPPKQVFVLNGVIDAERVALCFTSNGSPAHAEPLPTGGIAYARAEVFEVADVDPGWQAVVVPIDPAAVTEQSCTDLLAGRSATVALDWPSGPLAEPMLVALAGCIGGEPGTPGPETCGATTPSGTTLEAVSHAIPRSAITQGMGFQVLHASRASGPVNARLMHQWDVTRTRVIADGVTFGQLQPSPPFSEPGVDFAEYTIKVGEDYASTSDSYGLAVAIVVGPPSDPALAVAVF